MITIVERKVDSNWLSDQIDIVQYISNYVDLTERQNGEWWGLSPFKDEKTPSFSVRPKLKRFYDFSTGEGGDIIQFVMSLNKCNFMTAVDILKSYAGIDNNSQNSNNNGGIVMKKPLSATSIAKMYTKNETEAPTKSGVILPDDYMDRYEWNPDKNKVWNDDGITDEALRYFQVRYDELYDRLVYPIRDINGKIVNIGGRTLVKNFKELNIRKYTYLYSWGRMNTIYGLYENMEGIMQRKEVIIFEGAKSVMIAWGWGLKNAAAILTSHLNQNQLLILIKLGVRVVFALDADVDITKDKNIKKLIPYTKVEWMKNRDELLDAKDSPVDKGKQVFKKLYLKRVKLL